MAAIDRGRPRPRIEKIPFSASGTCPIDLFGPLANGRLLKRLHGALGIPKASVSRLAQSAVSIATEPIFALHPGHRAEPEARTLVQGTL